MTLVMCCIKISLIMARTVNFKSHRNHLLLFLTRKEGKQDNLQHTRHTVVASIARSSWCCQILLVAVEASRTLRALRLIGQSIRRPKRALRAGLKDASSAWGTVEPLRAGFRCGSRHTEEPFWARIAGWSPSGVHVGGRWAGHWSCRSYWTVVTDWTHIPCCSIWKVNQNGWNHSTLCCQMLNGEGITLNAERNPDWKSFKAGDKVTNHAHNFS